MNFGTLQVPRIEEVPGLQNIPHYNSFPLKQLRQESINLPLCCRWRETDAQIKLGWTRQEEEEVEANTQN